MRNDSDTSGGFFSGLFSCFFHALGEGYASLANPNYGPYPYYSAKRFYAGETGNAINLTARAAYQHTYKGIPTPCVKVKISAAAMVVDAPYQQYRKPTGPDMDCLHLAALEMGRAPSAG